jgi:DNA polymerase-3 subunit gamma/tau
MSYTALARRYRSQSFDSLVGQEPIAHTLRNAIATDRLHHAYLFTGTRGVGKTSMARLFARALNAPDTIADCPKPPGVNFPPLDVQQRAADAIMRGEDMNVIEIDAASNTGVDNVRDLIANASLAPSGNARFKVYIIDEVHMLSKPAFNALLKIMEEPPAHVKFILATTDPHKVLPTIISRCQRFDFRNIPVSQIVEHLRHVLAQEKVEADDAVIFQIARLGNGSMRDALSLLDRLLAIGQSPVTAELLERMLGVPDRQLVLDVVDAIASADPAAALSRTNDLVQRGISQDQILTSLLEHLRSVMVIGAAGVDAPMIDLDDASRQTAAQQAKKFDTASIIHAIALLENIQRRSKDSAVPRALLDAAVVRLALSEKFADAAALLRGQAQQGAPPKKIHRPSGADASPDRPPTPITIAPAPAITPRPAPQPTPQPPAPAAPPAAPAAPAPPAPVKRIIVTQQERDDAMRNPLVRQVADLFDARLVDLRPAATPLPTTPPDGAASSKGADRHDPTDSDSNSDVDHPSIDTLDDDMENR